MGQAQKKEDGTQPAIVMAARRRTKVAEVAAPEATTFVQRPVPLEPTAAPTSLSLVGLAAQGGPPLFAHSLHLEPKDLKTLQKDLKTFKASTNIKKLSCLEYFATRFTEIAYFEVRETGDGRGAILCGILGFGNHTLVSQIRLHSLTEAQIPSLFEILAQSSCYVGAIEGLRSEDRAGLMGIGFHTLQMMGVFPMTYQNAVTGLWICGAPSIQDIPQKEIDALKSLFKDLIL